MTQVIACKHLQIRYRPRPYLGLMAMTLAAHSMQISRSAEIRQAGALLQTEARFGRN